MNRYLPLSRDIKNIIGTYNLSSKINKENLCLYIRTITKVFFII